jgi:hypothetical protein
MFITLLSLFGKIKGGLWDHHAVGVSMNHALIFFSLSMQSVPYQIKLGDSFFPELLFISVITHNLGQELFILKYFVVFLSPS